MKNHIKTHHIISDEKMCKAEFTDEHDIEWQWYKCDHFCNNCQICVDESDENHTTHTLEEIEIDGTFIRQ